MDRETYQRLRKGETGTLALPDRARWKLSGPDRVRYLNGQVTNDVAKLAAGHALYAAVTTVKGKMVGDVFIAAGGDALWIDADGSLRETLGPRLEKYLIADDAVWEDVTESWQTSHVFGTNRPETPPGVLLFANARFGLPGFDVWSEGTAFAAGLEVGAEIAETLRLEFGLAKWGSEMSEDTLPPEAGLERNGISYTKGCYVGQETIARIKSIGHVNKQLMTLAGQDDLSQIKPGETLKAGDRDAGRLTSIGFSPALNQWIALGYIGRQHAAPGTGFSAGGARLQIIEPPLQ